MHVGVDKGVTTLGKLVWSVVLLQTQHVHSTLGRLLDQQTTYTQNAHKPYASLNDPMPKFNAVSRRCLQMAALVYIGKSICADVASFRHVAYPPQRAERTLKKHEWA